MEQKPCHCIALPDYTLHHCMRMSFLCLYFKMPTVTQSTQWYLAAHLPPLDGTSGHVVCFLQAIQVCIRALWSLLCAEIISRTEHVPIIRSTRPYISSHPLPPGDESKSHRSNLKIRIHHKQNKEYFQGPRRWAEIEITVSAAVRALSAD